MFRTVSLSIIRSLFTVHWPMVYVIQVCRQLSSRTRKLSETCRVSCQNKFVELVHLVGCNIKHFVTMQHGRGPVVRQTTECMEEWNVPLALSNKSRCLTNTPTRFGALRCHLQGVPFSAVKLFNTSNGFKQLSDRVLRKRSLHRRYTISESSWWSPRLLVFEIASALIASNTRSQSIDSASQFILPLFVCCAVVPRGVLEYTSGGPRNFFQGGSTNSVEDRENGDLGGSSPLVRGSGGSCNLVQEISFHMVKFS